MKRLLVVILMALWTVSGTLAAESVKPAVSDAKAKDLAKTVTTITGVAISPLLGVGGVGAYDYFKCQPEKREQLPWYAHVTFWLPALLLVGAVAAKDAFGTVLPPGLKKPLDVAETIENKVSGLVAAGAVVPMMASVFGGGDSVHAGWAASGFATFSFLNVLTIPLAVAAFVLVWLVGHVINVLILISPFGAVDAALKSLRTSLMGLLVIVHHVNPWIGMVLSLIIIVVAYFVAGWSFRLMVFGSVFTWDFITRKRKRFTPASNSNWMFTARKMEKTPVRTFGRLVKSGAGKLLFEYRPWLIGKRQVIGLPEGKYAVGRGLFYPDLSLFEGEKMKALLTMPPRYKNHEEEVASLYNIPEVRDTGLLKGIKAVWRWFTRNLFGKGSTETLQAAAHG